MTAFFPSASPESISLICGPEKRPAGVCVVEMTCFGDLSGDAVITDDWLTTVGFVLTAGFKPELVGDGADFDGGGISVVSNLAILSRNDPGSA